MVMKANGLRWEKVLSQPNLISQIVHGGAALEFFKHQTACMLCSKDNV